MRQNWQQALISPETPIIEALRVVDNSSLKVALVVDKRHRLLGIVTDGDVRRGILEGIPVEDPVSLIMNSSPRTASVNDSAEFLAAFMRNQDIEHLPILDVEGRVVGLEILTDLLTGGELPNWAVLMAGGRGDRLQPLTDECPKPLLPVGEKPLLETIIQEMCSQGFKKFFISINYLGEQVKEYFGDGSRLGVQLSYIEEEGKLGTAGALSLLPGVPSDPLVIVNGDVLTKLNFQHLLQFHQQSDADATMCVSEYRLKVPYGVANVRGRKLVSIDEKPEFRYLINAGIYVVEPKIVDSIKERQPLDMTDLFNRLLKNDQRAVVFPIREYWLDIGRLTDLELARGEFEEVFS